MLAGCTEVNDTTILNNGEQIVCDAEKVEDGLFVAGNFYFKNGNSKSSDMALSGSFSSKVPAFSNKGIGIDIQKATPGDMITIKVWKHANNIYQGGFIVRTGWGQVDTVKHHVVQNKNGWVLHRWIIYLEDDITNPSIEVFTFNDGNDPIYFDDFSVTKNSMPSSYATVQGLETLELNITEENLKKIKAKRKETLKKGVLVTAKGDKVDAILKSGVEEIKCNVRLKGDWLDHLFGIKWSFRIEVEGEAKWKEMKEFSLQNPMTRYLLHEWVLHKFFEFTGVITPRYEFINLKLNGKSLGLYVYEEHFKDELLEHFNRKPTPIIRFDESGFWDVIAKTKDEKGVHPFKGAKIKPFDWGSKISKSDSLRKLFEEAQDLLQSYKNSSKPVSDIFDIDVLAKYYACLDVNKAYHGFAWHNIRYYYNPVKKKLEPIGFDGYSNFGLGEYKDKMFLGFTSHPELKSNDLKDRVKQHVFKDTAFYAKYNFYLERYTRPAFVDTFFSLYKNAMEIREQYIWNEAPQYKYNWNFLYKTAHDIRKLIFPFQDLSLKVHLQVTDGSNSTYKAGNSHPLPIRIVGFGGNSGIEYQLPASLYLPPMNPDIPIEMKIIKVPVNADAVFYKVAGINKLFKVDIIPWKAPETNIFTPSKTIIGKGLSHFREADGMLIYKNADNEINDDIVIPSGYVVVFPANSIVNMLPGISFTCYSEINCKGTEDKPVVFQGGNRYFIQNSNTSYLNYTKIIAVSDAFIFSESTVQANELAVINCSGNNSLIFSGCDLEVTNIYGNNCVENTLMIVNSKGTIKKCLIENGGKNALEVSNSSLTIDNFYADNINGIVINSVGYTNAEIGSITLSNARQGIVLGDFSIFNVNEMKISGVTDGIVLNTKLTQFKTAKFLVSSLQYDDNVKNIYKVNKGGVLKIGDRVIENNS